MQVNDLIEMLEGFPPDLELEVCVESGSEKNKFIPITGFEANTDMFYLKHYGYCRRGHKQATKNLLNV